MLDENNLPIQPLSDAEIILNIQSGDEKNYFVFMLNHEDEKDGVMIGFGLNYHEDFSAYLHLPPKFLKELIEKYALVSKATNVQNLTVEQYLIGLVRGGAMNLTNKTKNGFFEKHFYFRTGHFLDALLLLIVSFH